MTATTATRDELLEVTREIAHTLNRMSQQFDALVRQVEGIRERVDQLADQRTYRRLSPEERDAMYQQMADDEARDPEYQREMAEWLNAPLGPYRSAGEARE